MTGRGVPLPLVLAMTAAAPVLVYCAWRGARWPMLLAAATTAWFGFGGHGADLVGACAGVLVATAVLADGNDMLR